MAETPTNCPGCGAELSLLYSHKAGAVEVFRCHSRRTGPGALVEYSLACVSSQLNAREATIKRLKEAMPPPGLLRFAAAMVQMPIPQLESVNPAAALRAAADAIEAAMKETA